MPPCFFSKFQKFHNFFTCWKKLPKNEKKNATVLYTLSYENIAICKNSIRLQTKFDHIVLLPSLFFLQICSIFLTSLVDLALIENIFSVILEKGDRNHVKENNQFHIVSDIPCAYLCISRFGLLVSRWREVYSFWGLFCFVCYAISSQISQYICKILFLRKLIHLFFLAFDSS